MTDNNFYNENNHMEDTVETNETYETDYHYSFTPNPSSGKKPNRKFSKSQKKIAKKIGAIALSAVLFGGVAAGAFQGVNYLSGFSSASSTSTASATTNTASLLKATNTVTSNETGSLDVSAIAEAAMPSIVSITNKSVQEVQNFFSQFGYGTQTQQQEVESCGSGFIIGKNDTELLIVTNNHVVADADTLSVCFVDNQAYEANIKGTDSTNDLAVIAVPLESISEDTMSKIAVAAIADSDSSKVGEQVVAIGNALGYGQSVTTGIISAMNRVLDSSESADGSSQTADSGDNTQSATYIQTDAAINPGNSGGALLNMNGEVIGINSAKLASTEVEGMGYAIPMSRASSIIETLMNETTRAKVSADAKGTLDIKVVSVGSETQQAYGIPAGVYISSVEEDGAAAKAGIAANDVITKFDGKEVTDASDLQDIMQYYAAGETVDVTVQVPENNTYTEKTMTVTLGSSDTSSQEETVDSPIGNFSQRGGSYTSMMPQTSYGQDA